jgi:hypothetical protein
MVKMLERYIAATTQPTAIDWVCRVAFDSYDFSVFDVCQNAAVSVAEVAHGLLDFNCRISQVNVLCHF